MRCARCALLVWGCLAALPVHSGENALDPQLTWRLPFGGSGAVGNPAVGLALRLSDGTVEGANPEAVRLALSPQGARLAVAGLPLWQEHAVVRQNDGSGTAAVETRPWYTRSWVLWTAGGLATTAAVLGGGGGNETTSNEDQGGVVCNGGNVGSVTLPDECVVSCGESCIGLLPRPHEIAAARDWVRERGLDAGTGGMGDLLPHPGI